jgi:hypothetical protein
VQAGLIHASSSVVESALISPHPILSLLFDKYDCCFTETKRQQISLLMLRQQ